MWKFDFPWMFLLLPLPALVWWLAPAYRTTSKAVRMPFFQEMADAAGEKPAPGGVRLRRNWLQRILMPLLWALLVAAAAKPVYVEAPITREEPARDLMLAIDLSQSMSARDFVSAATGERMDRLTAVRRVVADFIAKRKSDRIGLIVFGDAAYPQAPLTLDHDSVLILLDQMQIGMAGPRTAIGDAVGLSVKLMDKTPAPEKMLILLTDGNDTASAIPPQRAAEIAKDHRIVVHTIGIGDPQTTGEDKVDLDALKRISDATGGRSFHALGRQEDLAAVYATLDRPLKRISDATGGRSFHALGRQEDLAAVYATLDRITPDKVKREVYRPQRDDFWVPLALALSILTAYHLVAWLIAMLRAPRRERANPAEAAHGN